ncbi:MAG: MBL fold metallo-hydrolase [Solobacterium sp.]|nr:MBL fold metallo-hydrolase [Solobacterium sp.]
MMEFALLASGSKGNAFVLREGRDMILIDCGSTRAHLMQCFAKLGISPQDFEAVLITHDHSDHIAQIRMFLDRRIYAAHDINGITVEQVRPLRTFRQGAFEITPLALSHDAPDTLGFVIQDGGEKLVYVTDTGYLNRNYFPLLKDADYIIMESNHDVARLMMTRRPQYLKMRIAGDSGHLNNEDAAEILKTIVSPVTKMVILAHISQEANTREAALACTVNALKERDDLRSDLLIAAAGQYEMIQRGWNHEKTDPGTCWCTADLERFSAISAFEYL